MGKKSKFRPGLSTPILTYCYQPAGHIITGVFKNVLLIQEFDLLYAKDLNTGFLHQYTATNDIMKLLVSYKSFVIDGASESMLNLML